MTRDQRDRPADAASEETTPTDGLDVDTTHVSQLADEAREADTPDAGPVESVGFDTVPGGGMNRLSGGRSAARAYVRPKTPPPAVAAADQHTISIDVEAVATGEGRAFATIPSMSRRRIKERELDSLPPLADSRPRFRSKALWIGVALLALGAAFYFLTGRSAPVVDPPLAATQPSPALDGAPAPAKAAPTASPSAASAPPPSSAAPSALPAPSAVPAVAASARVATPPAAPASAKAPLAPTSPAPSSSAPASPTLAPRAPAPRAPSKPADSDPWLE
jgi:hypothetical protein